MTAARPSRRQPGGNTATAVTAVAQRWQSQFCSGGQLGGGGGLAAAACRQRVHGSRLLLVDCCLFLPPPSLLPQVSSSPPYLSLNSKMENTIVKSFLINIFQTVIVCCLIECFHGDVVSLIVLHWSQTILNISNKVFHLELICRILHT